MIALRKRFAVDLKGALEQAASGKSKAARADAAARAAALRLILAALEDRDAAARGAGAEDGVGDPEILHMLSGMVSQRRDSAAIYRREGRDDLAAREAAEIDCIGTYLPAPLDESETARAIAEAIADSGARSLKDAGRAMAALRKRHAGRMDFAAASRLVKRRLAGGA